MGVTDLDMKPIVDRMAFATWRGHVWDFVVAYDAVVNAGICSGALR